MRNVNKQDGKRTASDLGIAGVMESKNFGRTQSGDNRADAMDGERLGGRTGRTMAERWMAKREMRLGD